MHHDKSRAACIHFGKFCQGNYTCSNGETSTPIALEEKNQLNFPSTSITSSKRELKALEQHEMETLPFPSTEKVRKREFCIGKTLK